MFEIAMFLIGMTAIGMGCGVIWALLATSGWFMKRIINLFNRLDESDESEGENK